MARFYRYADTRKAPVIGGGGAAVLGGGADAPAPSSPSTPGSSPTGWVNVQDYLAANAGQAGEMGKKVAGELEKKASDAAPIADQYRRDVYDYMQPATSTENKDWTAWFQKRQEAERVGEHALSGFLAFNPEPKRWTTPEKVAPTMPTAPGEVLSDIKTRSTPAGLADYYAKASGPSYTAGQGALDSYFAQAGEGGQAIRDLTPKWSKVLDLINNPYTEGRPPGQGSGGGGTPGGPPPVGSGGTPPKPPGWWQPPDNRPPAGPPGTGRVPTAGSSSAAVTADQAAPQIGFEQPQRTRFTSGRLPKSRNLVGWSS